MAWIEAGKTLIERDAITAIDEILGVIDLLATTEVLSDSLRFRKIASRVAQARAAVATLKPKEATTPATNAAEPIPAVTSPAPSSPRHQVTVEKTPFTSSYHQLMVNGKLVIGGISEAYATEAASRLEDALKCGEVEGGEPTAEAPVVEGEAHEAAQAVADSVKNILSALGSNFRGIRHEVGRAGINVSLCLASIDRIAQDGLKQIREVLGD
jgi:hypothetical protein